ncbi:hypothetical protein EVG20_g2924 [Dentipellis fragilis]|uniref:Major facilitator superfamily (MFS) profile domain-containing protein n=1 Tax=Dentipellis fragilis TaxID=205917 RepID=A0A4Y9Z515_9AGAM|nr:hypothetical protein EVG20_g2924 [Dentipellis fragilis]
MDGKLEKKGFTEPPPESASTTSTEQDYQVVLEPHDNPQERSLLRRWLAVITISASSLCVTCASSAASFTEGGISRDFHVGKEVAILGISLFVMGLGVGPLVVGPLSEVYGRNIVYRVSFFLFFAFSWPVAFAPNIVVYLVFRFLTGYCGAAFLSVAGGSTDGCLHDFAFHRPELGPLFSGFINQNTSWRWTYYVLIIWSFIQFAALWLIVPETYIPVILKKKAQKLRKTTGNPDYWAPIERRETSLARALIVSCYTPFGMVPSSHPRSKVLTEAAELILYERMALLLNLWTSLILGILYLTFQAFPIIFEQGHGFNMQTTGLTFLGIGLGQLLGLATQPYWNSKFARYKEKHGDPPPELHLQLGQVGGILVPVSLFWLAFTTYRHVHWIAPIIASVPFGAGIYFVFTSTFTYLVVAYRPVAASAMASNSFMRSSFAAGFPLFAGQMYARLGTVGATALLAGLTTVMAPLPIGARVRQTSRFSGMPPAASALAPAGKADEESQPSSAMKS